MRTTSTQVSTIRARPEAKAIAPALLAALARLAVVGAIALWLVVMLLNEIATALVYVIAAALALFLW